MTVDRFIASGLSMPRLVYGCGGVWGMPWFDERVADQLLDTAISCGIDMFDTGPAYSGGRAEERLGRLLARKNDKHLVSTKVGTHRDKRGRMYKDYSPDAVVASFEASLARLQRDHVEILYVHGPLDPDDLTDELISTLITIKQNGQARLIGASCDGAVAEKALDTPLDILMMTINPTASANSRVARRANRLGMAVVAKSPMGGGRTGFPRRPLLSRDSLWINARTIYHSRLHPKDLFRSPDASPVDMLSQALHSDGVDGAVFGTLNTQHIRENSKVATDGRFGRED